MENNLSLFNNDIKLTKYSAQDNRSENQNHYGGKHFTAGSADSIYKHFIELSRGSDKVIIFDPFCNVESLNVINMIISHDKPESTPFKSLSYYCCRTPKKNSPDQTDIIRKINENDELSGINIYLSSDKDEFHSRCIFFVNDNGLYKVYILDNSISAYSYTNHSKHTLDITQQQDPKVIDTLNRIINKKTNYSHIS